MAEPEINAARQKIAKVMGELAYGQEVAMDGRAGGASENVSQDKPPESPTVVGASP